MADANELLGRLASACRIRNEARNLVDSLQARLEQAHQSHASSQSAVRSAEIDILQEAIERGAQHEGASEGKTADGMSITVELPQPSDPAIRCLTKSIVDNVCEAIVERLRNTSEGATHKASI